MKYLLIILPFIFSMHSGSDMIRLNNLPSAGTLQSSDVVIANYNSTRESFTLQNVQDYILDSPTTVENTDTFLVAYRKTGAVLSVTAAQLKTYVIDNDSLYSSDILVVIYRSGYYTTNMPTLRVFLGGTQFVYAIDVHYNNTDFAYSTAPAYAGKKLIEFFTVCPDSTDGSKNANTGLFYDRDSNYLGVVTLLPGTACKKVDRHGNDVTQLPAIATQGWSYNSFTGEYYVLTSTSIEVRDADNTLLKTLTFTSAQPSPGMVFYHEDSARFYCSYDANDFVRIWTPDFDANTLTLYKEITVTNGQEGVCVDYVTGNIWVNAYPLLIEIDHDGNILTSLTMSGGSPGNVNEGLSVDPTDGTIWQNKDVHFHGGEPDGNRLWHQDPAGTYDKHVFFPRMFKWETGLPDANIEIIGTYNNSHLRLKVGQSTGVWISPVMDFESFTMQQAIENITVSGNATLRFRGSATAPTTTENDLHARSHWTATQTGEGWGSTTPDAWSSSPSTRRYVQIEITLTN